MRATRRSMDRFAIVLAYWVTVEAVVATSPLCYLCTLVIHVPEFFLTSLPLPCIRLSSWSQRHRRWRLGIGVELSPTFSASWSLRLPLGLGRSIAGNPASTRSWNRCLLPVRRFRLTSSIERLCATFDVAVCESLNELRRRTTGRRHHRIERFPRFVRWQRPTGCL